jgi:SAM-dependent methyltransferase
VCGNAAHTPVTRLSPDAHRAVHDHTRATPIEFVACSECGLMYQTPRFERHELKPVYEYAYRKGAIDEHGVPTAQYLGFTRAKSRSEFEWIVAHREGGKGRALEIGCATGQLLRYFKDEGWDVVGVDPNRPFASYGERAHGIAILPEFFEEADLPGGFDLIILSQVLEHLEEPDVMLGRVRDLLAPNGLVYVSVPYYETWLPIRPAREIFVSTHFYMFSPASLSNVVARCGFHITAQEAVPRYLRMLARRDAPARTVEREDPRDVARRVRHLARGYFLRSDSRYLFAEWIKRRVVGTLGPARGERAIGALRRLKHALIRRPS